jgi:ferredoxin
VTTPHVRIDESRCVGTGECVILAGELFDQRLDDGVAFVIGTADTPSRRSQLDQAVAACPANAIGYREVDQEEQ